MASAIVLCKVVILLLLNHCSSLQNFVFGISCEMYLLHSVMSSFTIISLEKKKLATSFKFSSCCHVAVSVLFLFLLAPCVSLQCVIVALINFI